MRMHGICRWGLMLLSVALLGLALPACGDDDSSGSSDSGSETQSTTADAGAPTVVSLDEKPAGTEKLCGDKPIRMAQVDGFGGNAWREIVRATLKEELSVCPNVEISYTNADGDVQKYNSAINAYTAQGYDALVTFDDFADQGLPSIKKAYQSGMTVVPYISSPGGEPGQDYTAFIDQDRAAMTKAWAKWLNKVLTGKGEVAFLGGTAGNASSLNALELFKKELEAYPGITLVSDKPFDTNWDPATTQKVVSGLITKYPDLSALVADYGAGSAGSIRAYQTAGKPHPPMATAVSSNANYCLWEENHEKWPDFEYLSLDGGPNTIRWVARRAMADLNDIELDDPTTTAFFPYIDTTEGRDPECDKEFPPDADLSSNLDPETMRKLFE